MKLQFKVNPYYLLIHSLGKAWGDKPFPLWAKLANMAKSNPSFIFKNSDEVFTRVNNDKQLRHVFQKTQNILSTLLKTHEFKRLLQETERYCIWTEKEWNKNKDQALRILEDITGIQFQEKKLFFVDIRKNGKITRSSTYVMNYYTSSSTRNIQMKKLCIQSSS